MALSQDSERLERDGTQFDYSVKANAVIHQGAIVEIDGGHVKSATAAAGKTYAGVSVSDKVTGGSSDGDVKVRVRRRRAFKFKTITTGRNTVPALGATAYVHDDETVTGANDVAAANTVDRSAAGPVVQVDDDGVWVYFE